MKVKKKHDVNLIQQLSVMHCATFRTFHDLPNTLSSFHSINVGIEYLVIIMEVFSRPEDKSRDD